MRSEKDIQQRVANLQMRIYEHKPCSCGHCKQWRDELLTLLWVLEIPLTRLAELEAK